MWGPPEMYPKISPIWLLNVQHHCMHFSYFRMTKIGYVQTGIIWLGPDLSSNGARRKNKIPLRGPFVYIFLRVSTSNVAGWTKHVASWTYIVIHVSLYFMLWAGQRHPFTFDKVFNHDASQNDVFVEISQLVQSALDGYKVIYAYQLLAS